MQDQDITERTDYSIRVRCSPDVYKRFKGAFTMVGLTQHEALDLAFKAFADDILRQLSGEIKG